MVKKGLTIASICVFISAGLIFSGCRSHSDRGRAELIVDYIAETLDLTDQQRAQLEGIKEEFIAKAETMRADKKVMHDAFMAELRKEEIDTQRLKGLIAEKQEQMTEFLDLAVTRLAEFHHTLTPEQREKLVTKLEYFHKKHQDHWE
jgi:Spy/CpxP family protein refolding chaperone